MPSAEEKQFVFYLLDLLLKPELQRLQKHTRGEQEISRLDIRFTLFFSIKEMHLYNQGCQDCVFSAEKKEDFKTVFILGL